MLKLCAWNVIAKEEINGNTFGGFSREKNQENNS
jgi:hypothetical protein